MPILWTEAQFPGQPARQRSAPLVAGLMVIARGLLFPLLWWGNRTGRGDCLVIKALRR